MRGVFLSALLLFVVLAGCPEPVPDEADAGVDAGPPPRCPTVLEPTASRAITTEGAVRGVETETGTPFLGIRYATAPTGDERFGPPEEPPCIEGEQIATTYATRCPQSVSGTFGGEEDCLFLNVFTPPGGTERDEPAPVLFFVHGGGNVFGSAHDQLPDGTHLYDGSVLAQENDVIVVTVNYRLGALGFLVHEGLDGEDRGTSGNQALLDLIAALEWVQANIAAFGGDPERVLLFGESAGALNTCALLASERATGLFSSALMQSGGCFAATKEDRLSATRQLETATGCDEGDDDERLACLRALDPQALVEAPVFAAPETDPWSLSAGPVIDDDVLTGDPLVALAAGPANDVPLVLGSNADETRIWAPTFADCAAYESTVRAGLPDGVEDDALAEYPCASYDAPEEAWTALTTDLTFTCPARRIARAASDGLSGPVYRYHWSQPALGVAGFYGAFHASELSFVFGHLRVSGLPPDDEEIALSETVRGYWTRFATTGDPNGGDAITWPPFAPGESYLRVDTPLETGADLSPDRCDFWDGVNVQP